MPFAPDSATRRFGMVDLDRDRLVIRTHGRRYKEVSLTRRRPFTIGRGVDQELVLPGGAVSRRHAVIEYKDGGFQLIDQGSANGTFVDHTRVDAGRPQRLWSGSTVRIGRYDLRCAFGGDVLPEEAEESEATQLGSPPSEEGFDDSGFGHNATTIRIVPTGEEAGGRDTSDEDTRFETPLDLSGRLIVALLRGHRSFVVAKRRVLVGRGRDCDLLVPHPTVSSTHAEIIYSNDRFLLVDHGSTNGIYAGGERVDELRLDNATAFSLGHARCLFQVPMSDGLPAPDSCLDPDRERRFAGYLVDRGLVREARMRPVLETVRKPGQTLGELLLFRGEINIDDYARAVREYEARRFAVS